MSEYRYCLGGFTCPICGDRKGHCREKQDNGNFYCMRNVTGAAYATGYNYYGPTRCNTWGIYCRDKYDYPARS